MNKTWIILSVLLISSVLGAQETSLLGKEELLNAFKQYNPVVLQKASMNQDYASLLQKLSAAYSRPRTEENELEMIALVKNFDNSIILQKLKTDYASARTLQSVTGTDLNALEEQTSQQLLQLVEDIFVNTLEVKEIQIDRYEKELKAVKKDKTLSSSERKKLQTSVKNKIKKVKKEIKLFKKDKKQKLKDTANIYLIKIKADYENQIQQALSAVLPAQNSEPLGENSSVKSNPQKSAAQ